MEEGGRGVEARRWIDMEGAFNFRDLGGYRSAGGSTVRWGALFRSDALNHLAPAGVDALEALGVETIIDLRSPEEIEQVGRGLLANGPIHYVTAPVIPTFTGEARGAPPGDDMAERYLWYLDIGRQAFVDTFEVLTDDRMAPVVFHCAAGKDRTGVVAALVLSVLGVDAGDIAADYELTAKALPSILARLAHDPVHAEAVARIPPERRVVSAGVMARFLRLLDEAHGGAEAWLLHAGVTASALDRLRQRLLAAPSPAGPTA